MKLENFQKKYIKESFNYKEGCVVIFDEDFIPFDCVKSAKNAVAYFDNGIDLTWLVNGIEDAGFWQDSGDNFTGFYLYGDDPVLTTFSCHAYNVNMENGKLTYRDMTK